MYQVIGKWAFDEEFLNGRMSFISGPRQIGKTTIAKIFLESQNQLENYYNWDSFTVKRTFLENPLFFLEKLPPLDNKKVKQWVVFDEIHKRRDWKQVLKGYFDEFSEYINFVVCGSARLDIFRKTGESLLGRYFLFMMFPLGVNDIVYGENFVVERAWKPNDLLQFEAIKKEQREVIYQLFDLTGFPEPFLKGSKTFYKRWQKSHFSLIISEEIRDLTRIYDIDKVQLLAFMLPKRIGSPISVKNLADTLEVAHQTVKTWLSALENVFLIFQISPYFKKLERGIKKERKIYFWDWGIIEDKGQRFENFLALQLYRAVSAWNEQGWGDFKLHYVRTKDGKESDFLITDNDEPFILVESKFKDTSIDKNLIYFHNKLKPKYSFQVVYHDDFYKQVYPNVFVLDIHRFSQILI